VVAHRIVYPVYMVLYFLLSTIYGGKNVY